MGRKRTYKSIKKATWNAFAKYILLKYATEGGYVRCVTCGKQEHVDSAESQAGHVLDGRGNSILFEEQIVFPQCRGCNVFKRGNKEIYIPWFIDNFGREKLDEMQRLKDSVVRFTQEDLLEKEEYYKEQCKKLREEKDCVK